MPPASPLLVVAAALIDGDGRVLVQQRPAGKQHGGLWEFPGGKLEAGESPEAALVRELAEELAIVADPADCRPLAFAGEPLGDRNLILLLYRIVRWRGEPRALDAAVLRWVGMHALTGLPMPPADGPLVRALAPFIVP